MFNRIILSVQFAWNWTFWNYIKTKNSLFTSFSIFYDFYGWNDIISRVLQKKILFFMINFKLTKNNIFNIFFVVQLFLTISFYQFLKKLLDFHKPFLISSEKIFSRILLFPILRVKFSMSENVKRTFKKDTFYFK